MVWTTSPKRVRKGLFPLGGQDETRDDESEADGHVHQAVGGSTDRVHDGNLRPGNVVDDDVDQPDDEAGDHRRGEPAGRTDLGDLPLTLGRGWGVGRLLAALGLRHGALLLLA